ncbi:YidH family protein [Rhodobacter sp. CZR27]|uniref:YidH family protein n=1 Tax=Rhodobacter sp. CZR27 TaxID=2033869 RepID=UPI0018E08347|nr:DUF202 domain-containing protein [Rhodobacter sp. CZR27]
MTRTQVVLARIAVAASALFVVAGLVWYGYSAEVHERIWRDIAARPGGPMTFRFILQPCMAAAAAFHDGVQDARLGRSPYLWTLLTGSNERAIRLREGLLATGRIFVLALVMDAIYQVTVLGTFYPAEIPLVAILFAFLPYVLLRGPFARLARRRAGRSGGASTATRSQRGSAMDPDPARPPVTAQSASEQISVELSARRTGMSFQRTRMSADRTLMSVIRTSLSLISFGFTIHQVFDKAQDAGMISQAGDAPRNFGVALVLLGIAMLVIGIVYHVQFMAGLRMERQAMTGAGLIHGESHFPLSLTLVTAFVLLVIGVFAIVSMVFSVGPFG